MPSNVTQNYQLSQWSKDDQVKMEDFNADNAKIDAALGDLEAALPGAGHLQVLKTIVVPSDTTKLDIKLSDLAPALTDYLWLELWLYDVRCSGVGNFEMRFNDVADRVYSSSGSSGSTGAATFSAYSCAGGLYRMRGFFRLYPFSGFMGGTYFQQTPTSCYHGAWGVQAQYAALTANLTLNLSASGSTKILTGSKILVTGLKL